MMSITNTKFTVTDTEHCQQYDITLSVRISDINTEATLLVTLNTIKSNFTLQSVLSIINSKTSLPIKWQVTSKISKKREW